MKKYTFYIILFSGILLDLGTKTLANTYLENKVSLIGNFLYLETIKNPGIAFGLSINHLLLKLLTISLILGIFYYYFSEERKKKDIYLDTAFGLILAGAIGNGIERVLKSEVIDFIGVSHFSIFNIADSCITIGGIIYIVILYLETKKK